MPRSIHWFPWCNATFHRARTEKKPVMMYLTAPWCNWCRVMDETTYQDPLVISTVEKYYLPVKVNADQYPHVADRYHYGGYPTVVFLSEEGNILRGENYLPGEEMIGALKEVHRRYRMEKGKGSEPVREEPEEKRQKTGRIKRTIDRDLGLQIVDLFKIIEKAFDHQFGGFALNSWEPKFPDPEINDFLCAYEAVAPRSSARVMLNRTLDAMCSGEIYDREKGGFFRFCAGRDWSRPPEVKMLESNAGILRNLLCACRKEGTEMHRDAARSIIRYVLAELYCPENRSFGGSQTGNRVDPIPYTNWNCSLVSSLILADQIFPDRGCLKLALDVLESFWEKCYRLGRGLSHFFLDGPAEVELLSDQVKFLSALIDAFACTGKAEYLERAQLLVRHLTKDYLLPEGNFSDIPLSGSRPGYLKIPFSPFIDNVDIAMIFAKLAGVLHERIYAHKAARLLKILAPAVNGHPIFAAKYGQGLLELDHYRSSSPKADLTQEL